MGQSSNHLALNGCSQCSKASLAESYTWEKPNKQTKNKEARYVQKLGRKSAWLENWEKLLAQWFQSWIVELVEQCKQWLANGCLWTQSNNRHLPWSLPQTISKIFAPQARTQPLCCLSIFTRHLTELTYVFQATNDLKDKIFFLSFTIKLCERKTLLFKEILLYLKGTWHHKLWALNHIVFK